MRCRLIAHAAMLSALSLPATVLFVFFVVLGFFLLCVFLVVVLVSSVWREWYDAAMAETWIMQHNEPDWPLVRGKPVE